MLQTAFPGGPLLKLVLFSDLHLDTAFTTVGDQRAARQRRQSLRDTLELILDLATHVDADALLCGGDLYEQERFGPDTGAFLRSAFARVDPVKVFLAPGNHDWYGPASLYHTVDWSPNVHVFREAHLTPVELGNGITLWGAAHCAPAHTPGFLESFSVDGPGLHLALFHGSETGWFTDEGAGKTLHAPFDVAQIKRAGLRHALLGHYHHPRDEELFTYPGNPNPLAHGEDGERGAVVVTVGADGSIERVRHKVAKTEAHDLSVDVSGATSEQDVRRRVAERMAGLRGIARLTLHGDISPEVDLRPRELAQDLGQLEVLQVVIGEVHPGYDFKAIRSQLTVQGEFVRHVQGSALAPDLQRRVLVTGLRALDGRADLEVE